MHTLRAPFFVGLDLGQAHDYSAIAVLEQSFERGEWDQAVFAHREEPMTRLRHLERIRLGTPYPDVVERTAAITRSAELRGRCQLIVDGTGVGRPVVDLLRRGRVECSIYPVVITGGISETFSNNYYHVPKSDLVSGLQVALQSGRMRVARGMGYVPELMEEMAAMRVRVSGSGNEQFGASRRGTHDDLTVALALSLWGLRKVYPRSLDAGKRYWVGAA